MMGRIGIGVALCCALGMVSPAAARVAGLARQGQAGPLSVNGVIGLCRAHPHARYGDVAVRGYFVPRLSSLAAADGAGGLYARPHRAGPLHAGDLTPFVQVDWRNHPAAWLPAKRIVVRGALSCLPVRATTAPVVVGQFFPRSWHSG